MVHVGVGEPGKAGIISCRAERFQTMNGDKGWRAGEMDSWRAGELEGILDFRLEIW